MIKKFIKNLIRTLGYSIQKIPKEINEISINEILKHTLPTNPIIFDNVYDKHLNFLDLEKTENYF